MSVVSSQLIAAIARKLVVKYMADGKASELGNLILGPTKLADGLTKLLDAHKLDLGGLTELSEFVPEVIPGVIQKVIDQIQKAQGEASLKPDGVFGERTLKWLENRPFGHHHRSIASLPESKTSVSPGDGIHALRYFVENDRLPEIPNLREVQVYKLLREAWSSWVKVCNIDVKETGERSDANVIINIKLLNEPSSVLAIADVGPPGNRQLELTFDLAESWSPHKFQATCAHEIGHILGIDHIAHPRQLMNDTLHEDIKEPKEKDIAAAVAIWGKR